MQPSALFGLSLFAFPPYEEIIKSVGMIKKKGGIRSVVERMLIIHNLGSESQRRSHWLCICERS